jgi:hypothetical protein
MNQQIAEIYSKLRSLGIGTIRLNQAIQRFKDGVPYDEVISRAQSDEELARKMWLEKAMLPWCERHGVSLEQGISVVFNDFQYDPENRERDQVIMRDLLWNGQGYDFAMYLKSQLENKVKTQTYTFEPTQGVKQGELLVAMSGSGKSTLATGCPTDPVEDLMRRAYELLFAPSHLRRKKSEELRAAITIALKVRSWSGEIDPKDFVIETYGSGPAGFFDRPLKNVRIRHTPTGLVTSCDSERSPHANKAKAWEEMLMLLENLKRKEML